MRFLKSVAAAATMTAGLFGLGGCTTTSMVMSAMGVATDNSIPWSIVKHIHGKITEGDPVPCGQLNSVQRATSARCGEFVPGSIQSADISASGLQECPLILAAQDARLWAALPELISKGAQPERCAQSPLVRLAQVQACPDFSTASPEVLRSFEWLAVADARAVRHDTMRMLSCPNARTAGLSRVLDTWLASGDLQPENIGFSPLGALHPDYLSTPFAALLEARGHTAQAALGTFEGKQPSGFEEALRTSHWVALDWWLARQPQLVNGVPPSHGGQIQWLPLARVLIPDFLEHPQAQKDTIAYLMTHGADPKKHLPFDSSQSVIKYAKGLKSPHLALLDPPAGGVPASPTLAKTLEPSRVADLSAKPSIAVSPNASASE